MTNNENNGNSIESIFNSANLLPEKKSKVNKKSLSLDSDAKENGYAFSFAAAYHPDAGSAFRNMGTVLSKEETPKTGLDLLEKVGLDSDNFKIHLVDRVMPDLFNKGQYIPTEGQQVIAQWGKKQFEMNSSVSKNWADFGWEEALLPPKEIENAVIPFGVVAFDNGARVSMQYLVGDVGQGGILKGDAYLLTLMGSLDGSLAQVCKKTTTKIVCANTFLNVAQQVDGILGNGKLKRTANANEKLDLWKQVYAQTVEESKQFQQVIEKMQMRKIQNSEKQEFFTSLFGKSLNDASLSDKARTQLYNLNSEFVNHLENEQPGVEDLDTNTVYGWVQGFTSWNLRTKRVNIHGNIGTVNPETVRIRSRLDDILNTDTTNIPALQYLYQLAA